MNKDEILEKSRRENSKKDPYEMEINLKAFQIGISFSFVLGFILFLVQLILGEGMNYSFWSIIMAVNAGASIYKGIKLSDRKNLRMGAAWGLLTLAGVVASVCNML